MFSELGRGVHEEAAVAAALPVEVVEVETAVRVDVCAIDETLMTRAGVRGCELVAQQARQQEVAQVVDLELRLVAVVGHDALLQHEPALFTSTSRRSCCACERVGERVHRRERREVDRDGLDPVARRRAVSISVSAAAAFVGLRAAITTCAPMPAMPDRGSPCRSRCCRR